MKYIDAVNHPSLKDYFGKRGDKWIVALKSAIDKAKIGEMDVNDKNLPLFQKWSWMGFFFSLSWGAYHNITGWIYLCIGYVILHLIDMFFLGEVAGGSLSTMACGMVALWGRALLLIAKGKELSETGNLTPPSWGRVGISILIIVVPLFIAELILNPL